MISTKLNRLIREKNIKFFFKVESIADLNVVRGFIKVLGIKTRHVIVSYGAEVAEKIIKSSLKGCKITTSRQLSKDWFPVTFDTEGGSRLAVDGHLIVNYDPFKYCSPLRVTAKDKVRLRRVMRIKKGRKIMAASCSTSHEISAILRAYESMNSAEKPLLILGLRKPNRHLLNFLTRKGLNAHERYFFGQPLSLIGASDIVVLNTMGELFNFFKIADLAIVGHERNLFEPALLGIPVLYFGRPLNINKREAELGQLFKLFWRKNRTAKRLLDRFGGAAPIKLNVFSTQIDRTLRNPKAMIRGVRNAVHAFHQQIIPACRLRTSSILAAGIARYHQNFT